MSVQSQIVATANQYGVPPDLALAVAKNESSFRVGVLGPVTSTGERAIGTFQLMPATAEGLGVDPYDPSQNIEGGVRYLKMMLDRFGDPATAVMAYHAGPGNVERGTNIGPVTRSYVDRVMGDYGEPTFSVDVWGTPVDSGTSEVQRAGIGSSGTLLILLLGILGLAFVSER